MLLGLLTLDGFEIWRMEIILRSHRDWGNNILLLLEVVTRSVTIRNQQYCMAETII